MYEKYLQSIGARRTFYNAVWESYPTNYMGSQTVWIKNLRDEKLYLLDIDIIHTDTDLHPYSHHFIFRMSFSEVGHMGNRYYSLEHKGNRPTFQEMENYIQRMTDIFYVSNGQPFFQK